MCIMTVVVVTIIQKMIFSNEANVQPEENIVKEK